MCSVCAHMALGEAFSAVLPRALLRCSANFLSSRALLCSFEVITGGFLGRGFESALEALEWLPSVFNSQVLAAAVESFKTIQHATVVTLDFFLELLQRGFIDREQVEMLRATFQAVRRKCYRGRSTTLHVNGTFAPGVNSSQSFMDTISTLGGNVENMDSGILVKHLALNDTKENFLELGDDAHTSELNNESLLLVKIDEFLQRRV